VVGAFALNGDYMDTVLVVEDSKSMQGILRRLFESGGLEVRIASDGVAGLESFQKQTPTAVVLDLKLPGLNGKELCRAFKADKASIPIVVVSAITDVIDKVLLLELGADDYVTKPFSPRELLARVRRAIRRWGPKPTDFTNVAMKPIQHEFLAFGDVQIDFTGMEATRAGKPLTLLLPAFDLLKVFSRSPGRVFSREELLNEICGHKHYLDYPATRVVDNYILHLRQKLEPVPARPRYFLTMHGLGYKFKSSY
jgi:DNA-binding response OmpR family regulator